MASVIRPLYVWEVIHHVSNKKAEEKLVHYVILPSCRREFVEYNLGLGNWMIQGQLPYSFECLEQVSNMFCYSHDNDSEPTELQCLEFYNPGTDKYQVFSGK